MLIATLYGRLAYDPDARDSKSGKPMTKARVAVDLGGKDGAEQTLWVSLLAFGRAGEDLLGAAKGQPVAAMGRLTKDLWTAQDGVEREQWTLLADAVQVLARAHGEHAQAAAPSLSTTSGTPAPRSHAPSQRAQAPSRGQPAPAFDDPIPF